MQTCKRLAMTAVLIAAVATAPTFTTARAATAPAADAVIASQDTRDVAAARQEASVSRSAVRATTYKIGTITINLTLLSYAVGSVAGGGFLAAATGVTSWLVYTANDYFWDKYSPAPAKTAADEAFDASASSWRTTLKFLTFKPLGMGQKFFWLYVYTGSVATMMTWGTVTASVNTAWFYVNDMAWDWYDWYATPAPPEKPRPVFMGER